MPIKSITYNGTKNYDVREARYHTMKHADVLTLNSQAVSAGAYQAYVATEEWH